ncbi:hypothetical protein D3C72_2084260 [compost metagenome]
MATASPAINPPTPIATSDIPEIKYPIAAPGSTACDSASPTRLMRRSSKKTPKGAALIDKAKQATSARRIKPKEAKGSINVSSNITAPSSAAQRSAGNI